MRELSAEDEGIAVILALVEDNTILVGMWSVEHGNGHHMERGDGPMGVRSTERSDVQNTERSNGLMRIGHG